jgi:hypothetical protein
MDGIKGTRETDFSRSKSKRELPGVAPNAGKTPGPGYYEKPGAIAEAGLMIHGDDPYTYANSSAFASRVPMPHHSLIEEEKVRLVGPNQNELLYLCSVFNMGVAIWCPLITMCSQRFLRLDSVNDAFLTTMCP